MRYSSQTATAYHSYMVTVLIDGKDVLHGFNLTAAINYCEFSTQVKQIQWQ